MMWLLYEALIVLGLLLFLPGAVWRKRLPHRGWTMRLGRYPPGVAARLRRPAVWIHAVSVGEVLAAQPLLRALARAHPQDPVALSTITPGGFAVAEREVGERGAALYFPLDLRPCVHRALEMIRPRILILMESELWPTVMRQTHGRGVPIAVVNGRISPRAFARYRFIRAWFARTLDRVDLFLMQSQADADRLLALGAARERVRVVGSLKWEASLGLRPSPEAIREAGARIGLTGGEEVVVAGSTHPGEEEAVVRAVQAAWATHPSLRLIIAPRHLERLGAVEELIRRAGLACVRLSRLAERPAPAAAGPGGASGTGPATGTEGPEWQVGLVDTFGRLPVYYGLATVAFIGGSLIPHGGQNPLEAASLAKPILFGPFMHNFDTISHQLLAHHAARQLSGEQELASVLQQLLGDSAQAQAMGARARELTERFQGATERILSALAPLLGSGLHFTLRAPRRST